jgi:FtsZ-binding cell division protein ZapB
MRDLAFAVAVTFLLAAPAMAVEEPKETPKQDTADVQAERERLQKEMDRLRSEQKRINTEMRNVRRELFKLGVKERGKPGTMLGPGLPRPRANPEAKPEPK